MKHMIHTKMMKLMKRHDNNYNQRKILNKHQRNIAEDKEKHENSRGKQETCEQLVKMMNK